jgi:hypothetical protein
MKERLEEVPRRAKVPLLLARLRSAVSSAQKEASSLMVGFAWSCSGVCVEQDLGIGLIEQIVATGLSIIPARNEKLGVFAANGRARDRWARRTALGGQLEARLGIQLLLRPTTRSVSITEAGRHLLARFKPALAEVAGRCSTVLSPCFPRLGCIGVASHLNDY